LFGQKSILPYRIAFVLVAGLGAMTTNLNLVWALSDVFNGLMAIPNLIGLLFLSGVVIAETKRFNQQLEIENRKVS
jgi:AGCS family alanine or glycine:cation symporter